MNTNLRIDEFKADLKIRRNMHVEMKKVLKEKQANLKPGTYKLIFVANKKLAFINKKLVKKHVGKIATPNYFKNNKRQSIVYRIKRTIDYLVIKDVDVSHNKSPEFNGELVMLTHKNDIKIFDFANNLVRTFFTSSEYERRKENYHLFKNYFNMTVTHLDDDASAITEKLITFKPYRKWEKKEVEKLFRIIFDSYIEFGKSKRKKRRLYKNEKEIIYHYKIKIGDDELIQLIENYLNAYDLGNSFQLVKAHGDFTTNNVLLNEEAYFFINWKSSLEYIFFYDIYNLLFVDYLHTDDNRLLNYYLAGHLDEYLLELFDFYGIKYDADKRIAYLLIFICERITQYEYNKNPAHINQCITRYLDIVVEIILN